MPLVGLTFKGGELAAINIESNAKLSGEDKGAVKVRKGGRDIG